MRGFSIMAKIFIILLGIITLATAANLVFAIVQATSIPLSGVFFVSSAFALEMTIRTAIKKKRDGKANADADDDDNDDDDE